MGLISSVFLPLAIAFIMFSLGLNLKISDFSRIFTQPKDLLTGLFSQVIILPIVAFTLINFYPNLPVELAVGVMIIAAVPGGATSNFFCPHGHVIITTSYITDSNKNFFILAIFIV